MKANQVQKILIFQQYRSGENKIAGIRKYGGQSLKLEIISIDEPLSPVIDDTSGYLPDNLSADIVLDFLTHPDLSHDLAHLCRKQGIPMIASGKKIEAGGVHTPPT